MYTSFSLRHLHGLDFSFFSSVLQLLGCFLFGLGWGFSRIYFRLAFLCFFRGPHWIWDIGVVYKVKFYNIWGGVLLSENLGLGVKGNTEGSRGF